MTRADASRAIMLAGSLTLGLIRAADNSPLYGTLVSSGPYVEQGAPVPIERGQARGPGDHLQRRAAGHR